MSIESQTTRRFRLGDDGPQVIGWLIVFVLLITGCILKSH